ncbi:hypothetical protein BB560_000787, partial [Smittium megazygosporum]
AGGVVYSNIFPNNVVVLSNYYKEYTHLPDPILNRIQGHIATANDNLGGYHTIVRNRIAAQLSKEYSSRYLKYVIQNDYKKFSSLMENYIQSSGMEKTIKLEISDISIYVFFENACLRILGPNLSKNKEVTTVANKIGSTLLVNSKVNFLKINMWLHTWRYMYYIKKLSAYIQKEIEDGPATANSVKLPSGIEIIRLEREKYDQCDYVSLTLGLYLAMTNMVAIIPTKLVNILTDISINPYLQSILVEEQVSVITKYGDSVTSFTLSKMKKLAAFIDESIVLSSPATNLHRRVKKPIFLSNGTMILDDQYISANLFEKFHSKKDNFENRIFDIEKQLNGEITPDEQFLRDNVWGYGKKKCPAIEYSLAQMKLFVLIMIRKYEIFSGKGWFRTKHPGYRQIIFVAPDTKHIYVRKRVLEI